MNLGFITKSERDDNQNQAHFLAESTFLRFSMAPKTLNKGERVCLYDFWKNPKVLADVGFEFTRFHQITGSCVGAGGGNAMFSLIAVQRTLATNPTQAFIPWWPYDYGLSRLEAGMRGRGEGSLGSTFARVLIRDGVISDDEKGLPVFEKGDGLLLTKSEELYWSDGANQDIKSRLKKGRMHPVGTAAPCETSQDIYTAIVNGYPVTFACNNYIGKASVRGEGNDACVVGYWDGRGGHQQSVHAVWEHPSFGPLFYVLNNWPASVYPKDPAGGPTCGCWVTENNVSSALRMDAEVYALSHLNWFPAQPEVLDWLI